MIDSNKYGWEIKQHQNNILEMRKTKRTLLSEVIIWTIFTLIPLLSILYGLSGRKIDYKLILMLTILILPLIIFDYIKIKNYFSGVYFLFNKEINTFLKNGSKYSDLNDIVRIGVEDNYEDKCPYYLVMFINKNSKMKRVVISEDDDKIKLFDIGKIISNFLNLNIEQLSTY